MQDLRRCWNCDYKSHATSLVPQLGHKVCPRCGREPHDFVPSQLERAKGALFFDRAFGRIMRVGRERIQLFEEGFYRTNIYKGSVDKLDAYLPKFVNSG